MKLALILLGGAAIIAIGVVATFQIINFTFHGRLLTIDDLDARVRHYAGKRPQPW